MQPRHTPLVGVGCEIGKQLNLSSLGQFPLRLQSYPAIDVLQIDHQLRCFAFGPVTLEQLLDFIYQRAVVMFGVDQTINPPFAQPVPTIDPIADVHPASGAKGDVGRQASPDRLVIFAKLIERAIWLQLERTDSTIAGTTSEITNQKLVL